MISSYVNGQHHSADIYEYLLLRQNFNVVSYSCLTLAIVQSRSRSQ